MAASKPVRPSVRKPANRRPALDFTPRHLWLATLGLLVAGRREARQLMLRRGQSR